MQVSIVKYEVLNPLTQIVNNNVIWLDPRAKRFSPVAVVGTYFNPSDYIVNEGLQIDYRVEFTEIFNYIASSGYIYLNIEEGLVPYYDLDSLHGTNHVLVITITEGEEGFCGVIDPEKSYYDRVGKKYCFYFYDVFTYIYNSIPNTVFPYYVEMIQDACTLDTILSSYNPFPDLPTRVVKHLVRPAPSPLNKDRLISAIRGQVGLNSFIDDIRKYYGAYIYIGADKILRLVNRSVGLGNAPEDISEYIIDSNYVKNFTRGSEYDSILTTDTSQNAGAIGAILTYKESGIIKWKPVDNLTTDLDGYRYYDARIWIQTNYLLGNRTPQEIANDYSTIISDKVLIELELNTLKYDILEKVLLSGSVYIIINITKDFINQKSNVELLKVA